MDVRLGSSQDRCFRHVQLGKDPGGDQGDALKIMYLGRFGNALLSQGSLEELIAVAQKSAWTA